MAYHGLKWDFLQPTDNYSDSSRIHHNETKLHSDLPHIICLTEHHLNHFEIENLVMDNYNLGAKYCKNSSLKGRTDIKTKGSLKRDLYLISRNSNDPIIKNYYKAYCKILTKSINEAKRSYYNKLISNSNTRI